MNYSIFNQTYSNPKGTLRHHDNTNKSYRDKTKSFGSAPEFPMYDEDRYGKGFVSGYEKAVMATKGILPEDNLDPVTTLFFSNENINRIQKMIRREIFKRTEGKYRLDDDQDESDLLIAMRAVLFDPNDGGRFLPFKIKRQVKNLNNHVVQYIVPDMIEAMKQQYGYLKEINQPLQPMLRPMNMSSRGRRSLPSIMSIYEA